MNQPWLDSMFHQYMVYKLLIDDVEDAIGGRIAFLRDIKTHDDAYAFTVKAPVDEKVGLYLSLHGWLRRDTRWHASSIVHARALWLAWARATEPADA